MTIKEAINLLKAIPIKEIRPYFSIAVTMAIDALKEKDERENPQPLTIEELQQMDNQPVYVVPLVNYENPGWCVMYKGNAYFPGEDCAWRSEEYESTWIAYRHKPRGTP